MAFTFTTHRLGCCVGLAFLLYSSLSYTAEAQKPPRFSEFKFVKSTVANILELYSDITDIELVVASNVSKVPYRVTIEPKAIVTKDAAARLIERALLEQAGVIVTHLEGKRASVTFNDALKIPALQTNAPVKLQ